MRLSPGTKRYAIPGSTIGATIAILLTVLAPFASAGYPTTTYYPGFHDDSGCGAGQGAGIYTSDGASGALLTSIAHGPPLGNGSTGFGYLVAQAAPGFNGTTASTVTAWDTYNLTPTSMSCFALTGGNPQNVWFNSTWGSSEQVALTALCVNGAAFVLATVSLTVSAYIYNLATFSPMDLRSTSMYYNTTEARCPSTPSLPPGNFLAPAITAATWQSQGLILQTNTISVNDPSLSSLYTSYTFGAVVTEAVTVTATTSGSPFGNQGFGQAAMSFDTFLDSYTVACSGGC